MKRGSLIAILIAIAWLASMAMLITRHYGSYEEPAPGEAPPEWLFEESWMGMYQGTNKIGYAVTKLEPLDKGYRATENSLMRVTVMGVEKEMKTSTEAFLDEGFRLSSFSFSLDSDVSIRVEGTMEGKELHMALDMGGVKTEKKLSFPEAPYMGPDAASLLKDLRPGKKIRLPMVSPSSLTGGYMELEVLGREPVTVMGLKQDAYRVRGDFNGAKFTLWVRDTGEILKQEAMGLTYIRESKEEATVLGGASIDIIADISVPVDLDIPENVRYLKVRLEGADLDGFELDGGVQTLSDENVVEIKIPGRIKSAMAAEGMDEYLGETFLIESNDPAIVSLAKEIVGEEEDPLRKSRLLSEWVYANIEKVPTMTIPSALEVLKSRRGDCNEHTALYTALARATGIPTRMAVGLAYDEGYFYYHAWPEIFMDQWVPIDPALGQFPADATHIRLLTGGLENQLKLGSVIGKLKIEGLEYR